MLLEKNINMRKLLALAVLTLASMQAQTITGSITGTVSDQSGAVVPGVKVVATNTATNLTYTAESNTAGFYNLVFLPVGQYKLTSEAKGFKKLVVGPFAIESTQIARVDLSLEVGDVTQSVEITAVAPILQTEASQTGETISGMAARTLPLNGRNVMNLALLVPGAVTPFTQSFNTVSRFGAGGRPYVNGNREQTNNLLFEGIETSDTLDNRVGYYPNVDALEEVKVITGNASAEFGNANGAVINMRLKSGGNDFRGSVFEFLRNDNLDANGFFNNRVGAPRRALAQNIFGGTFGGPIQRNKLFFFMDYQGTTRRTSGPATASVVPEDFRRGDLSRITRPLKDPLLPGACTTTDRSGCFTNNQIPPSRFSRTARALFGDPTLYPLPNNRGAGPLALTDNYLATASEFLNNHQADAKADYRFSEKDNLSGTFSIARYEEAPNRTVLPVLMGLLRTAPTTAGTLNWTRTISPSMVNEARIGFSRVIITDSISDVNGKLGANGNQNFGIAGGQPIAGLSNIGLGGTEGITAIGNAALNSDSVNNVYQFFDNFTVIKGRHTMKMGGHFLRYQQNRYYAGNNGLLGTFTYSGDYTGASISDFLIDSLRSKGRGSQTGKWGHRQNRIGVFFQDDFKVTSNFTLNLGLRWEYTSPFVEVADRQTNIDLVTGKQLFAGKDGNSRALYNPYYKQFMPRIGFAYTPMKKFVVRGAYGITSFMEGTGGNLRLPLNPPYFFESDVTFGNAAGNIATGFSDVIPRPGLAGGQLRAWNPNLRPAFIQQWNFTTEYQVTNTVSVTAAYVGQKGTNLVNPREYNQPLPGTGPFSTWAPIDTRRPLYSVLPLVTNISGTDSSSNMDYNAGQFSARKRFSAGLEFLANYTYSKNLTDNRGFFGSGAGAQVAQEGAYWQNAYNRQGDRGNAFFDIRHNFTVGGLYEMPFGKGRSMAKTMNPVLDGILGGWSVNYFLNTRSGLPITMLTLDRTGQATRGNTRPNRYREVNTANQTIDRWFGDTTFCTTAGVDDGRCAYGQPLDGTFGNSSIGTERAPNFWNFDMTVSKRFRVTEKQALDFRAEFFNLFNSVAFGAPTGRTITASNIGQITTQANVPRNIQFGLKYSF
jgi:hypothetical protein